MSARETQGRRFTFARLVYGTSLRRTLTRSVITAIVLVVICKFVFVPVRVSGRSMAPTYESNRINLVNRWAYRNSAPQRGDVVGIWPRRGSRRVMLMKRVVGLPGEAIGFAGGIVTVDGVPLDEPYVQFSSDWNVDPVVCGPDEYFVVGDNRSMPFKLHKMGRVPRDRIVGKMML